MGSKCSPSSSWFGMKDESTKASRDEGNYMSDLSTQPQLQYHHHTPIDHSLLHYPSFQITREGCREDTLVKQRNQARV